MQDIVQNMADFEKARVENVLTTEMQMKALQAQLVDMQAKAAWMPIVEVHMHGEYVTAIMDYHGKQKSVRMHAEAIRNMSVSDLTSAITSEFLKDLVFDAIRPLFTPQITHVHTQLCGRPASSHLMKG